MTNSTYLLVRLMQNLINYQGATLNVEGLLHAITLLRTSSGNLNTRDVSVGMSFVRISTRITTFDF